MDNDELVNTVSVMLINNKQIEENILNLDNKINIVQSEIYYLKEIVKKINIYLLEENIDYTDNKKIFNYLVKKNNNLTTNVYILVIINFILCSYVLYKINN